MQVMDGNCGGIIASYVYLSTGGPRFIKGYSILIGFVRYVHLLFAYTSRSWRTVWLSSSHYLCQPGAILKTQKEKRCVRRPVKGP